MDKSETIKLLQSEDWTKADALRAIESIDFNTDPDELTIRRTISSQFVGIELIKRQRLQSSQKSLLTKKTSEIESLGQKHQAAIEQRDLQIELLNQKVKGGDDPSQAREIELMKQQYLTVLEQRDRQIEQLSKQAKELETDNRSLTKVNDELKQDNKRLKNIVDAIRLRLAQDMKEILKYEDSDLRQAIMKLFKSTQG
jgi:uncharacterized protein YpuA (DUF1002 family)